MYCPLVFLQELFNFSSFSLSEIFHSFLVSFNKIFSFFFLSNFKSISTCYCPFPLSVSSFLLHFPPPQTHTNSHPTTMCAGTCLYYLSLISPRMASAIFSYDWLLFKSKWLRRFSQDAITHSSWHNRNYIPKSSWIMVHHSSQKYECLHWLFPFISDIFAWF